MANDMPLICDECGRVFTYHRRKRFCSAECQYLNWCKRKFGVRICEACGQPFVPHHKGSRYCSLSCGRTSEQSMGRGPREKKQCPICGEWFIANRDKGRPDQRFCSLKCAGMAQSVDASCPVYVKACRQCGVLFTQRTDYKSFCSRKCCVRWNEIQQGTRRAAGKIQGGTCLECGKPFVNAYGEKRRLFCSNRCSRRYYKRQCGSSTHRSRARRYGCEYEPVNRLKVFERDGWRCRICGRLTPRELLGALEDNAPELDHVIPLSKGGGHLWSNVQCACRECNSRKGAMMPWGQAAILI